MERVRARWPEPEKLLGPNIGILGQTLAIDSSLGLANGLEIMDL